MGEIFALHKHRPICRHFRRSVWYYEYHGFRKELAKHKKIGPLTGTHYRLLQRTTSWTHHSCQGSCRKGFEMGKLVTWPPGCSWRLRRCCALHGELLVGLIHPHKQLCSAAFFFVLVFACPNLQYRRPSMLPSGPFFRFLLAETLPKRAFPHLFFVGSPPPLGIGKGSFLGHFKRLSLRSTQWYYHLRPDPVPFCILWLAKTYSGPILFGQPPPLFVPKALPSPGFPGVFAAPVALPPLGWIARQWGSKQSFVLRCSRGFAVWTSFLANTAACNCGCPPPFRNIPLPHPKFFPGLSSLTDKPFGLLFCPAEQLFSGPFVYPGTTRPGQPSQPVQQSSVRLDAASTVCCSQPEWLAWLLCSSAEHSQDTTSLSSTPRISAQKVRILEAEVTIAHCMALSHVSSSSTFAAVRFTSTPCALPVSLWPLQGTWISLASCPQVPGSGPDAVRGFPIVLLAVTQQTGPLWCLPALKPPPPALPPVLDRSSNEQAYGETSIHVQPLLCTSGCPSIQQRCCRYYVYSAPGGLQRSPTSNCETTLL